MNPLRKICVVLVVDDLGLGGAERQVVELANNMDRNRFEVHICTLSDHLPLKEQLKDFEAKIHVVARKTRFDLTVVPRLNRLLRKLNADVVHGYMFIPEIVSRLAGSLAGTKLVVGSERNANRLTIRKSNILMYRLTRSCVDLIVANSNAGAKSHREIYHLPAAIYRVVHNGVDTERFRPMNVEEIRRKLSIPSHCPVVGVFANFKKQKNHAMLFRAFGLLLKSLPDARLVLVGDQPVDSRGRLENYMTELIRLVDTLEIRHRCLFLGHQNHTEQLYSACDVTVLSSFHEGTPNVLLESMACGIPVIATNVCDNKYIVKGGEVGFLVEVEDDAGMVKCIEQLLNDTDKRKAMGKKARQWVREEFSTRRLAEKMESIYLEFLPIT